MHLIAFMCVGLNIICAKFGEDRTKFVASEFVFYTFSKNQIWRKIQNVEN